MRKEMILFLLIVLLVPIVNADIFFVNETNFGNGFYNWTYFNSTAKGVVSMNETARQGWIDTNDLQLYFRLNNNSAYGENDTRIYDFSGNGNNGTPQADAHPNSSGKLIGGYDTDGNGDYITTPHEADLVNTNFTMIGWVRPKSIGAGNNVLMFARHSSATEKQFQLGTETTNQFMFSTYSACNAGDSTLLTSITVQPEVWYHVAFVLDYADNKYIYVNGELDTSSSVVPTIPAGCPMNTTIGANERNPVTTSCNATFDELAIFHRLLTAEEIKAIYDKQRGGYYATEVFDFGDNASWDNISWAKVNDTVNISAKVCSLSDCSDVPNWTALTDSSPQNLGYYGRYFQSRFDFTSNPINSILYNITIGYTLNVSAPNATANASNVSYITPDGITLYYQSNQNLNLRINCYDTESQYCNATVSCSLTITNQGNGTILINNQDMTYDTTNFLYSLTSDQTEDGNYKVDVMCTGTATAVATFYYTLNPTGNLPNTAQGVLYVGLLAIMIGLVIFSLSQMWKVESMGWRVGLLCLSYLLALGIFLISWQISEGYLSSIPLLSTFFYIFFLVTLIGFFPFIIGMFFYLMIKMFNTQQTNKLMGMGYSEDEARKRIKKR